MIPRILLPLLVATLWAGPARADLDDPRLQAFLQETVDASAAHLDTLAQRFNPYQLPFLAATLAADERLAGDPDPLAYRAMVRWQYWLGKQLDPGNEGFWGLEYPEPDPRRHTNPLIASLELLHLRALAEMALHRDHPVDALIWWQDLRSLRQRMTQRLYDPATGGFATLDSLGHPLPDGDAWPSLLPIPLGAPAVPTTSGDLAQRLLLGEQDERESTASLTAMAALDPSAGWALESGPDRLPTGLLLDLVVHAFDDLDEPRLRRVADRARHALGYGPDDARVHLGDLSVPIPPEALDPPPLLAARAGSELFRRLRFAPTVQCERLRVALLHAVDAGTVPDSTATLLAQSVGAWRQGPWRPERSRLMRNQSRVIPPNGDTQTAAFRYREEDAQNLAEIAVSAMLEDLLGHHLTPRTDARYRARLWPPTVAAGMEPELTLTFDREADAVGTGSWTGAWTDGLTVRPGFPLEPVATDHRTFVATPEPPPGELGIWWLIVEGPAGKPRVAPGAGVVESLLSSIAALGPPQPDGAVAYELRVRNRVDQPMRGRVEVVHPEDWEISPQPNFPFTVEAYGTARWTLHLHPGDGVGPRLSDTLWRVYEDNRLVSERTIPVAVPLQWLSVGTFSFDPHEPLERRHGPESEPSVATRYRGQDGTIAWRHVPAGALQAEGWVRLIDERSTAGVTYALTALTTSSRDAIVALETTAPAILFVNGRSEIRLDGYRRHGQEMVRLETGANRLLLKMFAGDGTEGRFRVQIEDLDGGPLQAVDNGLGDLLDGYAYVKGSPEMELSPEAAQRQLLRRVPIHFLDTNALSVSVVGSFNGWSPTAHPMVKDEQGNWVVEIPLRPGRFEYKLAVDGDRWVPDPDNPVQVADGFGGINSVLVLD